MWKISLSILAILGAVFFLLKSTRLTTASVLDPQFLQNETIIPDPFNFTVSETFGKCIPKIIHQTWKTNIKESLPSFVNESISAWQKKNPEFIHRLWNDTEIEQMIKIHYSYLLPMYHDLDPVQKADLFRYLILLKYGGVYGDCDTTPNQPLREWFSYLQKSKYNVPGIGNGSTVEVISAIEHGLIGGNRRLLRVVRWPQITQWAIVGCPGHPVFQSAVDRLFFKWKMAGNPGVSATLDFSGPGLFSDAINDFRDSTGVIVLPECGLGCVGDQSESLVTHHFQGSWKKPGWGG